MPYPEDVDGSALVNYQTAPVEDDANNAFSFTPPTPLLQAHAGDPVVVHALGAPGNEQIHVLNLGGLSWPIDPNIDGSDRLENRAFGPWEVIDARVAGGAGGPAHSTGDFFYGDTRRPFTQAGMWGIQRVLPPSDCSIVSLNGNGNCP